MSRNAPFIKSRECLQLAASTWVGESICKFVSICPCRSTRFELIEARILIHGGSPILGCDVWEHLYYIDYRNTRPAYLEAFVDNQINWDCVAELYAAAKG